MIVDQVNEVNQAIEALKVIMNNPWMLTFLALFLLGWLLKENTKLPNELIPWGLSIAGVIMGLFLIEYSIAGAVIGCALAYIEMAFYDKIRGTFKLAFGKNEPY